MSVALLGSLVLALGWTTNLGTRMIRRGGAAEALNGNSSREEEDENSGGHPAGCARAHAVDSAEASEQEQVRRMMAAEEASLRGGYFERILKFYERWMRRALEHPVWLGGLCAILIVVSYVCYTHLGSDLLPAMDEGGFILDYVTPLAARCRKPTELSPTSRTIVRSVPEVESTSRRTGLQLGLAAVTEPNTGDIR